MSTQGPVSPHDDVTPLVDRMFGHFRSGFLVLLRIVRAMQRPGGGRAIDYDGQRLMSVAEVSRRTGIPKRSLYRLAETGKIRSRRVGRRILFSAHHVDEFLAGNDEGIDE